MEKVFEVQRVSDRIILVKLIVGQRVVTFLARLDEVQEELLYYPRCGVGIGVGGCRGVSKMFKFLR